MENWVAPEALSCAHTRARVCVHEFFHLSSRQTALPILFCDTNDLCRADGFVFAFFKCKIDSSGSQALFFRYLQ